MLEDELTEVDAAARIIGNLHTFVLSLAPKGTKEVTLISHSYLLGLFTALKYSEWAKGAIEISMNSGWPDPSQFIDIMIQLNPAMQLTGKEQIELRRRFGIESS